MFIRGWLFPVAAGAEGHGGLEGKMADAAGAGLRDQHEALCREDVDPAAGACWCKGLKPAGRRLAEVEHGRVGRAKKQAVARAGEGAATCLLYTSDAADE